jgi:hypothetical protein
MKKILATLMMAMLVALMLPLTAEAHPGCQKRNYKRTNTSRTNYNRPVSRNYNRPAYRNTSGRNYSAKQPSFYRRHRNAVNVGIGTGAGALIGGVAGGKRGALLGAAIGAGGGAVYSYGIKPKKRRYYRVR